MVDFLDFFLLGNDSTETEDSYRDLHFVAVSIVAWVWDSCFAH